MAHPASRVLALLELLQAHRRMTVGELSERLAVDERTVRRYAGTLAELGIPVTAERGRYGGYRLLPGFKLPPLMLTDDEAVAVVLGLLAADRIGLSSATPAAAMAEAKISRVLPPALAERLTALRESLGFTMRDRSDPKFAGEADGPETGTLLALGAAVKRKERLAITYSTRLSVTSDREIDPYGLVFHSARWYVVAHDHRSGEVRSFRADRVMTSRPTGVTFEPPPGFDAVAHLNKQWRERDYTWEVEVLVGAHLAAVQHQVPPSVAELIPVPQGVLLKCRVQNLRGMAQLLAGLGEPFTVIKPDVLRQEVVTLAEDLVDSARAPAGDPFAEEVAEDPVVEEAGA